MKKTYESINKNMRLTFCKFDFIIYFQGKVNFSKNITFSNSKYYLVINCDLYSPVIKKGENKKSNCHT